MSRSFHSGLKIESAREISNENRILPECVWKWSHLISSLRSELIFMHPLSLLKIVMCSVCVSKLNEYNMTDRFRLPLPDKLHLSSMKWKASIQMHKRLMYSILINYNNMQVGWVDAPGESRKQTDDDDICIGFCQMKGRRKKTIKNIYRTTTVLCLYGMLNCLCLSRGQNRCICGPAWCRLSSAAEYSCMEIFHAAQDRLCSDTICLLFIQFHFFFRVDVWQKKRSMWKRKEKKM